MSIEEIIDELNLTVMGYSGYITDEERQDTVDVFEAWIHGRLLRKKEALEELQKKYETVADKKDDATALIETITVLNKIIKHAQYDHEKIKPFLKESFNFEQKISFDITRLDKYIHIYEEKFCKMLENLNILDLNLINESTQVIQTLLQVMEEKTKRVNTLNKVYFILQENIKSICKSIHETNNADELLYSKIDIIINKYPQRISSYEKPLDAFKTARPFYQNYDDKTILSMKKEIFQLYIQKYPQLIEKAKDIMTNFVPNCDSERKSIENLKKYIDNPPDFEKLQHKLDQALEILTSEN